MEFQCGEGLDSVLTRCESCKTVAQSISAGHYKRR